MSKTNSGLLAYAKAQLGRPYWYGTFGQYSSAELYEAKKAQYPEYYTANDFSSQYGQKVHDCIGLIKGYMWSDSHDSEATYVKSQDKGATGFYIAAITKGSISTFPMTAGLLVFRGRITSDGPDMDHVGVYGGDGYVYEAQGHATGVVRTSFPTGEWTHWAQCPYITDDTSTDSEDPDYEEFGPVYTEFKDYTVVYGDTLGKIAIQHGFTVSELLSCNDIPKPNLLLVGQVIKIPLTGNRSWVCEFKKAINSAGIATLPIDDDWDTDTEAAASNAIVQNGTSGAMATFAQTMLLAYGYSLPLYGADGVFGSESVSATISYQSDHSLVADGIIGLNTWKRMLLIN